MKYERAIVKEYGRKDGRNKKQINLGVGSVFKNGDVVNIYHNDKITTFKQGLTDKTEALESQINQLQRENQKLKNELSNNESDKNNIIAQANANMLEAKDKIIDIENEIAEIYRQHAEEMKQIHSQHTQQLKEVNNKLDIEKDLVKSLIVAYMDLYNRGLLQRVRNTTPDSSKMVFDMKPKYIDVDKKE